MRIWVPAASRWTSRRWRPAPTRWRGTCNPLLVNTVVGFIGPEYLYDGKQIIRAGLEDHFCGKLLGLPMGVDVCYTNHAEADQNDMDTLLTLLAAAGVAFVITVPGADDVMLGYQSLSFHDVLMARRTLGLRPAPEFEALAAHCGHGRRDRPADTVRRAAVTAALIDSGGGAVTTEEPAVQEFWDELRKTTQARIGLGRAGNALPTRAGARTGRGPRRRPRRGA